MARVCLCVWVCVHMDAGRYTHTRPVPGLCEVLYFLSDACRHPGPGGAVRQTAPQWVRPEGQAGMLSHLTRPGSLGGQAALGSGKLWRVTILRASGKTTGLQCRQKQCTCSLTSDLNLLCVAWSENSAGLLADCRCRQEQGLGAGLHFSLGLHPPFYFPSSP